MSVQLAPSLIQVAQVLTIAVGSPLVTGVIARVEAVLQGRHGPRVLQPYYDLAKLFRKEALAPVGVGPFFLVAPFLAMACYLTVPLLIPVLTSYALPLGFAGDILGSGFILALASFVVAVAAAETGDSYAQVGSSRSKTFAAITEPVMLLVVFTVAIVTTTDLPYVLGATVRSGPDQIVRPAHLLASAALFMVILFETGRIPIETHTGTTEFGMIEEGRPFEHSGPYFALLKWGSMVKQLVLFTVFLNVFVAPWGLASTHSPGPVLLAVLALLGKACALGCVIAVIDDSFAKLRLFKITEFVAAAFLLATMAIFTLYLGGG
ncbi:MAG: NADH-quinone oxidoreductase subunit H [Nocardioides sp.]|uniref:respiratory chain complex I subunit 1 family protein n=1 Tax=Nocardioides sp. TaxID=35761 RepID=UPI0039E51934